MMDNLLQVKQKISDVGTRIGERFSRFVTAIGGKVEGISPLPPEQTAVLRKRAAYCTAFTVLGFLFESSTSLFGSEPYGIALLLCAGHANTVFVWLGELAGVFASGGMVIPRLVLLTLILFARFALSGGTVFEADCTTFGEPFRIRLMLCVIFAFLSGICRLVVDGLSLQTLLGLFATVLLAPLFCTAFRFAFDKSAHPTLHEVGLDLLLFVLISSLHKGALHTLSLALILSYLLILHTGMSAGILRGTLIGLICGIACGEYGVLFAVTGLAAGALIPFGTGTAVLFCGLLCIGIAMYSGVDVGLIRLIGDVIFASLIFLPMCKAGILKKIRLFGKDPDAVVWFSDPVVEKSLAESRKKKLSALSNAFDEISLDLMKLSSDLRHPGKGELQRICENGFERVCRHCALSSICWQSCADETASALKELSETLCKSGHLTYEDFPESLRRRCRHSDQILREIGNRYAERIEAAITKDKTDLFAMDYAAIAQLLRENGENTDGDGPFASDPLLRKKAEDVFEKLGIGYLSVGAFGIRQKSVILSGVEVGSVTVGGRQIAAALSSAFGRSFSEPEFRFRGDFVTMTFHTLPIFRLMSASASQPKKGEATCGDQVSSFSGGCGYAYALLCDGMGSGADASAVSEVSAVFLRKMLSAGNSRAVSLKLLSSLLCSRAAECHSTVDLLEVDLFTGSAVFEKYGAAPSYLYRGGKLFRVDAKTLPIGIVKDAQGETTKVDLLEDDLVIMVSDGVGGIEDTQWLPEMIAKGWREPVAELASAIRARAGVESHFADDISVIVMRMERAATASDS